MSSRTRVVQISEDGYITLYMPDMTSRYLVVDEVDGQIILKPYDLRWQGPGSSIAKFGSQLHYIPPQSGDDVHPTA